MGSTTKPWSSLSSLERCESNVCMIFSALHEWWHCLTRAVTVCPCTRITNLKYWGGSEQIISKTLQLLSDLSVGYGTVRKLVKLEEVCSIPLGKEYFFVEPNVKQIFFWRQVNFLLSHHTAEHYPFLGVNVDITEMRCRSMFYTSLGEQTHENL